MSEVARLQLDNDSDSLADAWKVTHDAQGYEYMGRKFVGQKLWAPTADGPFLAAHLKSVADFPPSQGADTLSMRKAVEEAMRKLESPNGSSN